MTLSLGNLQVGEEEQGQEKQEHIKENEKQARQGKTDRKKNKGCHATRLEFAETEAVGCRRTHLR